MRHRVPLSSYKAAEVSPAAIPTSVARAMAAVSTEVTAYLSSVEYAVGELSLKGVVFGDREKRFNDGDAICTSIIRGSLEVNGYLVVRTLNSSYVVCDWAGEGARGSSIAQH